MHAKVMQLNNAHRLIKKQQQMDHNEIKLLEWPVIVLCSQVLIIIMIIITTRWHNKGGHSPVAGYSDFQLWAKNSTSLTYHPTTVG